MYPAMLFFIPGMFSQIVVPVVYGPDPVAMAREMGAVHRQMMADNMAMQRQIFSTHRQMADRIPADGKVHTYENKIPGGVSRGSSYHSKDPGHEEFSESHSSFQSYGTPMTGTDDGTDYSSSFSPVDSGYIQTPSRTHYSSSSAGEGRPYYKTFSEKLPGGSGRGHVYENSGPGFHEYSTSYSSAQSFGNEASGPRTIPITTEGVGSSKGQTYVRPSSSIGSKATYQTSDSASESLPYRSSPSK